VDAEAADHMIDGLVVTLLERLGASPAPRS